MQGRHDGGLGPGELAAKYLREQMVVAVPQPFVVQWHNEKVVMFDDINDLRRVGRPGDGVAQRCTEPVQNGGPGQELPDLGGLAAEHFFRQEVDNEAVVAGELADERTRRGVTVKRKRREVDTGGPS